MPICDDCGNETHFSWRVDQSEERIFDPETGEHIETKHTEAYDSYAESCGECGSTAVLVG